MKWFAFGEWLVPVDSFAGKEPTNHRFSKWFITVRSPQSLGIFCFLSYGHWMTAPASFRLVTTPSVVLLWSSHQELLPHKHLCYQSSANNFLADLTKDAIVDLVGGDLCVCVLRDFLCVCVSRRDTDSWCACESGYSWPLFCSNCWGKCASYLKWSLFWWSGGNWLNVLHYQRATCDLYQNLGWGEQKENTCITWEPDVTLQTGPVLFLVPPPLS